MPACSKDGFHLLQFRQQSPSHRLPQDREPSPPRLRTTMCEAEEIERLRLALSTPFPIPVRKPAELDQACLFGVQFQPKPRETFAQFSQESLGISSMLEPHDKVVSVPHDDHVALRLLLSPSVGPEVEHVVKVDVGQ